MTDSLRAGEVSASVDPASAPADAGLVFIGRARTTWLTRENCPKNVREARGRSGLAEVHIDPAWRAGLADLRAGDPIILLTWLDRARRDLLVQAPRHSSEPASVFSLRSPVRPNPIGVHIVRLASIDIATGRLAVDALDCLDGTPILDIKPWIATVDVPPD